MGYQIRVREGAPFMVGQIVEEQRPGLTFEAPEWLPADGREVDVLAEPDLFGVIGYRFGGSDGTFRLPDLRVRPLRRDGDGSAIDGLLDHFGIRGDYHITPEEVEHREAIGRSYAREIEEQDTDRTDVHAYRWTRSDGTVFLIDPSEVEIIRGGTG